MVVAVKPKEPIVSKGPRPLVGPADFRKLQDLVVAYSVHPDALALVVQQGTAQAEELAKLQADNAAAKEEGRAPQTEVMLVKFKPGLTVPQVGEAADILHKITRKPSVSPDRVKKYAEKGFMMVTDPSAIFIIRRMASKAVAEAGAINTPPM